VGGPPLGCAELADESDLPASTFDFVLKGRIPAKGARLAAQNLRRIKEQPCHLDR